MHVSLVMLSRLFVLFSAIITLSFSASITPFDDWDHLRVKTGNVSIHVRYHGKGPPLLLVHGFPQHSLTWIHVGPILAQHYTVIAPDLRGMGNSGISAANAFDAESCADDIFHVLNFLKINQTYAFGHDKGSGVLAALTIKFGGRIDFVRFGISEYPLPGFGYETSWTPTPQWNLYSNWQLAFFAIPDAAQFFIQGREREMLSWYFFHTSYSGTSAVSPDLLTRYVDSISKAGFLRSGLELFAAANIGKDGRFFKEHLASKPWKQPVLVLGGEASLAPTSFLESTFRSVAKNLTVDLVPKAGHWIADENPIWLANRLLQFFGAEDREISAIELSYLKDKVTLDFPPMY